MNGKYIKILASFFIAFLPLLSSASFTVIGDQNQTTKSIFDHYYAGASFDVNNIWHNDEVRYYNLTQASLGYYHAENIRGGISNVGLTLFGGRGWTFNRYYLGGELFAKYMPTSSTNAHVYETTITGALEDETKNPQVSTNFGFGAALRAGYLFTPRTLIYGLLGGNFTQFKTKLSYNSPFSSPYTISAGIVTKSFDDNRIGIMPGIGVETYVANNIVLRAQYAYIWYSSINHSFDQMGVTYDFHHKVSVNPNQSVFSVGAEYLFDNNNSVVKNDSSLISPAGVYAALDANMMNFLVIDDYNHILSSGLLVGDSKYKANMLDFGGTFSLGYGNLFRNSHVYWGAEMFAQYIPSTKTDIESTSKNSGGPDDAPFDTDMKFAYGADMRLGYMIEPRVLAYGLLGFDVVRFDNNLRQERYDFSKTAVGLMPGVGCEMLLTQHFSIRGQYTYSFYKKFEHSWPQVDHSTNTIKQTITPNRSIFGLGVVYHIV